MSDTLLDVRDMKVHFPIHGGALYRRVATVKAVDGVSFTLERGEVLGLVGESGCGKSTLGRSILNLLRHVTYNVEVSGNVRFEGHEILDLPQHRMRPLRKDMQMIFQDPFSSLNPRMSVLQMIADPLRIHTRVSRAEREEQALKLMEKVGLRREQANRYPHEFSGGQRQRISIARALATRPKLVIADEPVSALDVSIRAQVINLMQDLQDELNLTYLFIAHDLSVVRHISDRIAVMYLGNIVEIGPAESVYTDPKHPYTRALISAVPQPDPRLRGRERIMLPGDVPSPMAKPSGCGFRNRCPIAKPACADVVPPLAPVAPGALQWAACPYWQEFSPRPAAIST